MFLLTESDACIFKSVQGYAIHFHSDIPGYCCLKIPFLFGLNDWKYFPGCIEKIVLQ